MQECRLIVGRSIYKAGEYKQSHTSSLESPVWQCTLTYQNDPVAIGKFMVYFIGLQLWPELYQL